MLLYFSIELIIYIMTSWSDKDLECLSQLENHKIVQDIEGEYRWMHRLSGGKWDIHSIQVFESEKTPLEWMYMWVSLWDKELKSRKSEAFKMVRKERNRIHRSKRMSKAEKSISLRNLLPELTQQEIANEIGVGIATVKRYLKK